MSEAHSIQEEPPLSAAFMALAELLMRSGKKNLKDNPEPLFQFEVGQFHITLNCRLDEHRNEDGVSIPGCTFFVEANGWPLGLINPYGGALMSSGREESTEDAIIREASALTALKEIG